MIVWVLGTTLLAGESRESEESNRGKLEHLWIMNERKVRIRALKGVFEQLQKKNVNGI